MARQGAHGVVIVGAGLAGYSAARALRSTSKQVPITLLTADQGDFYSKPTLSVSTSVRASVSDLVSKRAEEMQRELDCTLLTRTTVLGLDLARRLVLTAEAAVPYDDLVLALGAEPWLPPVPGLFRGPRVLSINHLEHYGQLGRALRAGDRVIVLGAGLVGVELANDLARGGYRVTLLDRAAEPLPALVPPAVGQRLRVALQGIGVSCRFGATPLGVVTGETWVRLELDAEPPLEAELLLCATGLCPTPLARDSGLKLDRGIVVDAALRTSDPHVYALGDCASIASFNLQFVAPISYASTTLARALLGESAELKLPPLPISVKTPCFPLVGSAGPRRASDRWEVAAEDDGGISALAYDEAGQLCGFALGGSHAALRGKYLRQLPPTFQVTNEKGQP